MPNLVEVTYAQTGESSSTNDMGMRAMQARAYDARDNQHLLIKAPPASGKSRALMFIALDKLHNQGVKKAIVAVPERSIGGSFGTTNLSDFGFFTDWHPKECNNLCTPGGDGNKSKVETFKRFMQNDDDILICTHATLRFACEQLEDSAFDNVLLAIDEFHHVSAQEGNVLGEKLRGIIANSSAHIVAMTGSYFRGDSAAIMLPEDEAKFAKVSFNYYEQLNGYEHLKSLGIGYHFYQGTYTDAIGEVLDTDKKTIIHIPNVNSGESTKDKFDEVDAIIDEIGEYLKKDEKTGVITIKRKTDGKIIKLADLVNDEPQERDKLVEYLRNIKSLDDMDVIVALGMAKEGFDWAFCEHSLTIGYRGSLTEVIQIIGRCTRDSSNKSHAQFTNLIAQPNAQDTEVKVAVNNMLKAISCSLLMEQVLTPVFKFTSDIKKKKKKVVVIDGLKPPSTKRSKDIIDNDLNRLATEVINTKKVIDEAASETDPEVTNKSTIPKVIKETYPDLTETETEEVRQHLLATLTVKPNKVIREGKDSFIKMGDKFVNIDDLSIDLIDSVNPFQDAFEVLSKSVDAGVLKLIQESIESNRIQMTNDEAFILWPKVKTFYQEHGKEPDINTLNTQERRLAECLIWMKQQKRNKATA